MGVTRLNHAVLYVSDLERSVAFYRDVLGFERVPMTPDGFSGAAFLRASDSTNDHDLGLFEVGTDARPSAAGRGAVGLYHLAWEVDTLDTLEQVAGRLEAAGALVGDHFVVPGVAAHHAAQRDRRLVPAAGGDRARSERQFERAGHPDQVDRVVVHAMRDQRRARALHQRIGDARVPAAGEDGVTRTRQGPRRAFDLVHGRQDGDGATVYQAGSGDPGDPGEGT